MLSTMTYSIELLFSAIFGLSLGFAFFGKHHHMMLSSWNNDNDNNVENLGESDIPCCHDVSSSEDYHDTPLLSSTFQEHANGTRKDFDYVTYNDDDDENNDGNIGNCCGGEEFV